MKRFLSTLLVAVCTMVVGCLIAGCVPEPRPVTIDHSDPTVTAASSQANPLLDATNTFRAQHGLTPLGWDARLQTSAGRQAFDCGLSATLTHVGRDGSTEGQRITAAGLRWSACAENAAFFSWDPSAAQVVEEWTTDAGHLANLLGPYARMGAAYSRDAAGNTYWVADYASALPGS